MNEQFLRIGIYQFFPGGGIGRYTHELATYLNAWPSVDVEVMCSPAYHWVKEAPYPVWPGLRNVWHPSPLRSKVSFVSGQVLNPRRALLRARQKDRQVIHFSDFNHLTFPLWKPLLQRSGMKMGITVHDIERKKTMVHRGWEDRQLIAIYQRADVLFVHSEVQKAELAEFASVPADRITIVPHGAYAFGAPRQSREALRQQFGLPEDKFILLFFGQIRNEKNLVGCLEALTRSRPEIHLFIAGKPWSGHQPLPFYQSHINRLGLGDRVTFLSEFIPNDAVGDVFHVADWVVLPYLESFTSQSGVLNIAAHYQKPMLVSSAPVISETVAAYQLGITCGGDDPGSLTDGMEAAYTARQTGRFFQFDRYLDDHSWQTNARTTIDVYQKLLGTGQRADRPAPAQPGNVR